MIGEDEVRERIEARVDGVVKKKLEAATSSAWRVMIATLVVISVGAFAVGFVATKSFSVNYEKKCELTEKDRRHLQSIEDRWAFVDQCVAQVVTDQRVRQAVVGFVRGKGRDLMRDEDDLFADVRARLGVGPGAAVAVTDSGTAWVGTGR